jgi:hypothetical protein
MRFDDFVGLRSLAVAPVDRFGGFVVEVGVPQGWYPFDSSVGMWVWVCRSDPRIDVFCANAVLTMHCVEAALDAGDVFEMLAEQQLESALGSHEQSRTLNVATEGPGVVAVLAMEIADKLGVIESVTRTRIITAEQGTMIAQLTVTAMQDSPANRGRLWLTVCSRDTSGPAAPGPLSGNSHGRAWSYR